MKKKNNSTFHLDFISPWVQKDAESHFHSFHPTTGPPSLSQLWLLFLLFIKQYEEEHSYMCYPRSHTCFRLWSASTGREGEWKRRSRRSRSRRRRGTEGEGGWREGQEEEQEGGRKLLWELLSRLSGEIMTDLSARLYFTPHHREISKKINKEKKKKWCNNLVCSAVPAQTLIFSSQSFFFSLSLLWRSSLIRFPAPPPAAGRRHLTRHVEVET